MTTRELKLLEALLMALTLDWSDNGNISADAIRDACLQVLSEVLDVSLDEIIAVVDQRIQQKQ